MKSMQIQKCYHNMKFTKVAELYNRAPLPLKATFWFSICQFLQKGISLLTTPFIARLLSTFEYGRVSAFASWESICLLLVALSSFKSVNYICTQHKNRKRVLSSLEGYNIVISLIWGVLFFFNINLLKYTTGLSSDLILCLYLYCAFTNFILGWQCVKQYDYLYRIISIETLILSFGTAFGGLASILIFSRTAEAKIIPQVVITVIIGSIIIINAIRRGRAFYDKEIWKFTFGFCVPLLPHYLSEIVLLNSDKIMIDRMCGSSDVAIYSVAYTVGSLISMVTGAINSAFAPYQCQKIAGKEYKVLAKNTNYIIAFVAFCLCGVMFFGREIVLVFGGHKYIDSISLIIPISLGVFFNYVFQLFARVQEYFEQKHTIVIASISCAVLNIALNYIFINQYGYKAAAYTTFVCYFSFCFLHYLFYRKVCKRCVGQEIYDIKGLMLISIGLIVISLIIGAISKLYILKYIILIFAIIIVVWQRKRIIEFAKTFRER